MPRPSRHLDQALLASGAALYPALGCAGLSVRAVASLAGVTAGMFHYHFESKDALKTRGLTSPDRADAVALALYEGGIFDVRSLI